MGKEQKEWNTQKEEEIRNYLSVPTEMEERLQVLTCLAPMQPDVLPTAGSSDLDWIE